MTTAHQTASEEYVREIRAARTAISRARSQAMLMPTQPGEFEEIDALLKAALQKLETL